MPFTMHPYRSVPVCCPVIAHTGLSEGHGIVWDLSLSGWRLVGDVPLHGGGDLGADHRWAASAACLRECWGYPQLRNPLYLV
jgi:hypothetical protein